MPIVYEGGSTPQQDTQTDYTPSGGSGSDYSGASTSRGPTPKPSEPFSAFNQPAPAAPPAKVPGQPTQPAPDPQTTLEKQQSAINSYVYARAQRYLVGSAFTSQYEKAPSYWDPDATTHGNASWWVQHPVVFGNTITANVPEAQHRKLVKHMPQVYDWMAKNDRVAGIDGVLTGMRLTALHMQNADLRTWAINYIDSIKQLNGADQQAVVAHMMEITGSQNPNALLHEALSVRRGMVRAFEATPEYIASQREHAKTYKNMVEGERSGGAGLTGQAAVDFASQQYNAALQAQPGGVASTTLSPEASFWLNELEKANAEYHQEQVDAGVHFSEDNGIIGNMAQGVKDVVSLGNKAVNFIDPLNKYEENLLAPHISNWWKNGHTLPFTVHFNPDYRSINQTLYGANPLNTLLGKPQPAPPSSVTSWEQTHQQLTLHHLSAQSEVAAAATVATIVFAPGLVEFFGNQALNLAKIQAFMKILHGVNLATQQAGQNLQGTNVQTGINSMGMPGSLLNPIFHVGGEALSGIAGGLHAATATADNIMLDVQSQLAQGTATVSSQFGWQMSDMQMNIAAQIEMAMLMESMGRIGSDIKTNLGMTADAAAGQIGVGQTLADTYRLNDSSLFHPYRAVMDPLIDYHVTQFMQYLHATDLPSVFERWNDSNFLGRRGVFDIISGWQAPSTSGPTDWRTVLGKIRERYPMLPESYAETLAKTPRDQMLGASMDYIHDWGIGEFKTTTAKLNSVLAKMSSTLQGSQYDAIASFIDQHVFQDMLISGDQGGLDPRASERMTSTLNQFRQQGLAEDMGNNIWKISTPSDSPLPPEIRYMKTDALGQVLSVRQVDPRSLEVLAQTLEGQGGKGMGKELLMQHWADMGVTDMSDPAAVIKLIKANAFSDQGAALNKSAVWDLLANTDISQTDAFQSLLAEEAALRDHLTTLQSVENEVISNLPTHSMPDFLHRVMYRPVGPVEGAFRFILNFGRYTKDFANWSYRTISGDATAEIFKPDSQSWAAKLVDKLDRRPQLRYASDTLPRAERQIIEDNNAQIMDRVFQRMGFSPEDSALIKGRLAAAKSQDEWFTIVSRDLLGEKGPGLHLMAKYLPDNTPTWLRNRILSMNESGTAPKYYMKQGKGNLGTTSLEPLLPGELVDGARNPLPAAPSMFKNTYNLPLADMETAMNGVARWRARVGDVGFKKGNLFNNTLAQVYDWGKAGLSLTTAVGKPLSMVLNIPAIIATKMLDETMGNAMDPRILRQFKTRAEALDYFSRVDPRILGKVVAGGSWVGIDGTDITSSDVPHTAGEVKMNGMDRATAESVAQRLVDMSTDPFIRQIALENDPERVLAILRGHTGVEDPYAEGTVHFYRGSATGRSYDTTGEWFKNLFGSDTSQGTHEDAIGVATSYDAKGQYQHFYLDPQARILTQGTPEFDALAGPDSMFHSSHDPNMEGAAPQTAADVAAAYKPGMAQVGALSSTESGGKGDAFWLDDITRKAREAGYQAIHMTNQDAYGTAILDRSILRDPYTAPQPVMADERLQRFYQEQLIPQVERSLEATYDPKKLAEAKANGTFEDLVHNRAKQLISDWQGVIHDATWQHPDLLDFVKHGRMGGRGLTPSQAAAMTEDLAHKYQSLQEEATNLREALSKLDPKDNTPAYAAAQQHLHDKLEAIDHIENQVLGSGDQTDQLLGAGAAADQIRQDTQKALADRIQALWNQNELTAPNIFTVRSEFARMQNSSATDLARGNARRLQDFMYRNGQFQFIGKVEAGTAKGSFFAQRADQIARGYIASGMRADEAMALAEWKALDETRDFNYDITAKSTAERSVRNLMWFAPVQGELMYRWLYRIPATMGGWLPGSALMAARLTNWYHLLKTTGLVTHDSYTNQDVIPIHGLVNLINHMTGDHFKLPDTENVPLLSINPHLFGVIQNPLPALSPGPSFLLNAAAAETHSKVLMDLSALVGQGGTSQFIPSAANSILGAMGIPVGKHMLGTSYQRLQWDRAHDVGLQYAWTDMAVKGQQPPPALADFGLDSSAKSYIQPTIGNADKITQAENAYKVAWAGWFSRLNTLADQYARGAYALNAISSTILPGYIQESSTDQRAYQQFFRDNILPQIDAGGDYTQTIQNQINQWLAQHPSSQAFAVSYNYYTGQDWTVPYQQTDPQYAKELYAQGIKAPMDPTDYANYLAGKATIETYRSQLNSAITDIAPDGKPQTLLRNWYKRGLAVSQYSQQVDEWNRLNPDAVAAYNKVAAAAQKVNGEYPHQGLVYEYVATAMDNLRRIAPALFGGDTKGDFKTVMSTLGQAKAELYQKFPGAANDPMAKGINWYFDNVVSPFYDTVNPLYEKAKRLTAQGADPAVIQDIYHQIDDARRPFDNPAHGYPSPQEFAYSSLSSYDQKLAVITWSTQPPSWLSQFQYEKVYGQGSYTPAVHKLWDEQYKFNKTQFLPLYNTTSPSSKYADSLKAWRDQQYAAMAQYYQNHGVPNAVEQMKLEQGAPYLRLQASGWGKGTGMQTVYDMAQQANDAIEKAGNSPAGFSQTAVAWKTWFYNNLNQFLAQPDTKPDGTPNTAVIRFKAQMDALSQSQKTVGTTGIHPSGLSLYEEIFFNNFSLDKYGAPTSITNLFK